ncbi:MAG: riboflavin synthase [Spirochaetales bacterium]|nr:riboflavin synthase [Spirochaetales bacterium]
MFTGLIEEIGVVRSLKSFNDGLEITIQSEFILESLKIGDSIAIDGVCQTVTKKGGTTFTVEAVGATLLKTTFLNFKQGRKINLERPMSADGRFDGHFVQGHVEGIGKIVKISNRCNHLFVGISIPNELLKNIVINGSVAVDGISLTVASVFSGNIGISIISHTIHNSTIGNRKVGDSVNIETDLLGRYVAKQLEHGKTKIDGSVLKKWGY